MVSGTRIVLSFALIATAVALSAQSAETSTKSKQDARERLIGAALADSTGYDKLAYLCDRIGNRLGGSHALQEATEWAAAQMGRDGLANVSLQPVKVVHWVRGHESLHLLAPAERDLPILGLGLSVGTPPEGIAADVVVVSNFDELEKLGRSGVAGKIVLFNAPFVSYSQTVPYRGSGPSRAARLGAVAALVRSVGSATLRTPHTGALNYAADAPRIPAAAVTIEDAMMMQRLVNAGNTVKVRLTMEAKELPPADSANVIGEVIGREKPQEVVVIGGHLDSWDVGQGAHDDGAGCVVAMQAAHLIQSLGLRPRRTIRVVLWTNEENGQAGGKAYRAAIGDRIANHVAAIEMDGGSERPVGFDINTKDEAVLGKLRTISKWLDGIGASGLSSGRAETDVAPLADAGVPVLGLRTVMEHYFDWHHTQADTVDKVNPRDFRANVAAMAVMAYSLAEMPERLATAR